MAYVEKAGTVFGWMSPPELHWLGDHAKKRTKIVEIGCFEGRSTRVLADNTPGTVVTVDPFKVSEEYAAIQSSERPTLPVFLENLKDHLASGKVMLMKMESSEAASCASFFGDRFDMVFIDGAHDYESVKKDIEAWRPLLMPGGLLCGHDMVRAKGVSEAVMELVPKFSVMLRGSIWYKELN